MRSLPQIAAMHNIGTSTLQKWVRKYRLNGSIESSSSCVQYPILVRFDHLVATAALDPNALSVYCRENSLYGHQLQIWKEEFMTGRTKDDLQKINKLSKYAEENKVLQLEIKNLKHDLDRKNKALAEMTALVILK